MAAWIMLFSGCFIVGCGVLILNGWRAAQHRHPGKAGWGFVAAGGGLALDGVPKLAGWSSGVGLDLAAVAMALVVLGAVLQIQGRRAASSRHRGRIG
ncbi:hypothetical protein [Streptomyces sp. NPDC047000]|uniref:hypothetical protein n=1 Tax=Streptomyces sp. NPDC047000 TaxID=3155474 RepID=UPI0033CA9B94